MHIKGINPLSTLYLHLVYTYNVQGIDLVPTLFHGTAVTTNSFGLVGVSCQVTCPETFVSQASKRFLLVFFVLARWLRKKAPGTRKARLLVVHSLFSVQHPRDFKSSTFPKVSRVFGVSYTWYVLLIYIYIIEG